MDTIRTKIRSLLNDNSTAMSDVFTYSNTSVFTVTEPNVIAITDVYVNDVASGVIHTYDTTLNKVTVSSSLTTGDTIQVDYTTYPNYSTTELTSHVRAALVYLSINNYGEFLYDTDDDDIYPTLTDTEENLVAMIAALIIDPDNRTIRLPDVTITNPTDVPTNVKISKTIASFKRNSHRVFDII